MKALSKISGSLLITFLFLFTMSGCSVVGDIFKAGVWVGVLMVAVVIGVIIFIVVKMSGSGNS